MYRLRGFPPTDGPDTYTVNTHQPKVGLAELTMGGIVGQ